MQGIGGSIEGFVEHLKLLSFKPSQHILFRGHGRISPDPYLYSIKLIGTEALDNGPDALVAAVSSIPADPYLAKLHIKIVMDEHKIGDVDVHLFYESGERFSGKVHVSIRLCKDQALLESDPTP